MLQVKGHLPLTFRSKNMSIGYEKQLVLIIGVSLGR